MMRGFASSGNKGFHITFANGWAISVQYGPGNYADIPGGRLGDIDAPRKSMIWEGGPTAEIAVFPETARNQSEWLSLDSNDKVRGWVTPEQVAQVMYAIAIVKPGTGREEVEALVRAVLSEASSVEVLGSIQPED